MTYGYISLTSASIITEPSPLYVHLFSSYEDTKHTESYFHSTSQSCGNSTSKKQLPSQTPEMRLLIEVRE